MKTAATPHITASEANHTLLIQLADAVGNVGKQVAEQGDYLTRHITEQQEENRIIHTRINDNRDETTRGITEIKDSLASRGRLSAAHVAVALSAVAMLSGLAQAYISVRLGNITPLIDANTAAIAAGDGQRMQMREELTKARIESARSDATGVEARRWLEKRQDEQHSATGARPPVHGI
jgi:hypothetical protein